MPRLSIGLLALAVIAVLMVWHWLSPLPPSLAAQAAAGNRPSAPIAVTGAALAAFRGAAVAELSAWAWGEGGWRAMHVQLDERDERDFFVPAEDGLLDDNDELVLASGEFGQPRAGAGNPGELPADAPYYEIVLSDPLSPAAASFAYVYWSAGHPAPTLEPLVSMDEATSEIRSSAYVLGFAQSDRDGFVGIARLSLHGRPEDLLDRMKIRLRIEGLGLPIPLNETMLAGFGLDFAPEPVVSGPVRLLFDRLGRSWAGPHHLRVLADLLEIPGGGQMPVRDIRLSFDLSREALPASYSDANVPAGVVVDGQPDAVPASPLPAWREVRTTAGRFVMLATIDTSTSAAAVYYKDDRGFDLTDTGDMASLGDQGVAAADLAAFASAGFPGLIVVPPAESDVSPTDLLRQAQTPLAVTVREGPNMPTPGPTWPPTTRTPLPTRSATVGPRPTLPGTGTPFTPGSTGTSELGGGRLYLPLLMANA